MKSNKSGMVALSSLACLLPVVLGVVFYPQLPQRIAIHWSGGVADNFAPRWVVVFLLPAGLLAVHLLSVTKRRHDPRAAGHPAMLQALLLWAVPCISLVVMPVTYTIALGYAVPVDMIVYCLAGCTMMVLGNYLPKARQNYTIGIKLPWTLANADNWNKTHRLAGRLYIAGGLAACLQAFLLPGRRVAGISAMVVIVVVLLAVPFAYSLALYKRQGRQQQGGKR